MLLNNILLLHFSFVLIDVFLPNLCDYEFIMIMHVILRLNEREIQKKYRKENNQEDQISELTFNFHGALSILNFLNELTVFTKKSKKKKRERKRKIEVKRGERKERKKREKNFLFEPPCQKSQF